MALYFLKQAGRLSTHLYKAEQDRVHTQKQRDQESAGPQGSDSCPYTAQPPCFASALGRASTLHWKICLSALLTAQNSHSTMSPIPSFTKYLAISWKANEVELRLWNGNYHTFTFYYFFLFSFYLPSDIAGLFHRLSRTFKEKKKKVLKNRNKILSHILRGHESPWSWWL